MTLIETVVIKLIYKLTERQKCILLCGRVFTQQMPGVIQPASTEICG